MSQNSLMIPRLAIHASSICRRKSIACARFTVKTTNSAAPLETNENFRYKANREDSRSNRGREMEIITRDARFDARTCLRELTSVRRGSFSEINTPKLIQFCNSTRSSNRHGKWSAFAANRTLLWARCQELIYVREPDATYQAAISMISLTGETPKGEFDNQPISRRVYSKLYDRVIDHLSNAKALVIDAWSGRTENSRMPWVITNRAPGAEFASNIFIVPTEEELESFSPRAILHCPEAATSEDGIDGLPSSSRNSHLVLL